MKVKQRMTPSPITARPTTTHREAMRLLEENHIRRLPVVDDRGRLIGIVTDSDLLSTAPSQATTLSIYEIATLLDRLTLDEIMTTPVYAVDEECGLATAARFMRDNRISALPIMRGEKLVGIITETDIFKTFVEMMAGGEPGFRVDINVADEPGQLAAITNAIAQTEADIVSLATFEGGDTAHGIISLKVRGVEEDELRAALKDMDVAEFRAGDSNQLLTFA